MAERNRLRDFGDWLVTDFWDWLTKSCYTRSLERAVDLLESQVTELRRDNRALMNSVLASVGHAPIDMPERLKEVPRMRRRSWQQLNLQRTMQSARKTVMPSTEEDEEKKNV